MANLGILPVHTRFREKHLNIVHGDLLEQNIDQFVFSAYNGGYSPTETSIWGAAAKKYCGYPLGFPKGDSRTPIELPGTNGVNLWGNPKRIGDTDVVIFETGKLFSQNYPLIALHMIGSGSLSSSRDLSYGLRKALHNLHFACYELDKTNQLGPRLGLPLLGCGNQGLPVEKVVPLLKQFAENALSTIDNLDEIVIVAFSEDDAELLQKEFKLVSGQSPLLNKSTLPSWQQTTLSALISELNQQVESLPLEQQESFRDVLVRFSQDPMDKEGIAISARAFLQKGLGATKGEGDLIHRIDHLNSQLGTPNIWASSFHLIRIIGNTAAHPSNAVRRVNSADLVSILMGLKAYVAAWPKISTMGENLL